MLDIGIATAVKVEPMLAVREKIAGVKGRVQVLGGLHRSSYTSAVLGVHRWLLLPPALATPLLVQCLPPARGPKQLVICLMSGPKLPK